GTRVPGGLLGAEVRVHGRAAGDPDGRREPAVRGRGGRQAHLPATPGRGRRQAGGRLGARPARRVRRRGPEVGRGVLTAGRGGPSGRAAGRVGRVGRCL